MTQHEQGSGFEERLLHELRRTVAEAPAPAAGRPARRPVGPRRRLALGGAGVLAVALAAAVGVPYVSDGAAPAYAVSKNEDGTVTVQISSLRDAAGLQQKLADAGVRAVVQYLPPGKACRQPWFTRATPAHPASMGTSGSLVAGGHTTFTIANDVPAGDTLVIATGDADTPDGGHASSVMVALASGEVPACQVVDAPAGSQPDVPPAPAGAVTHSDGPAGQSSSSEPSTASAAG